MKEYVPILRALNMAGIPWGFSGTSGLYARPEVRLLLAFLRVAADLGSSVDLYALAASEVYGLGGEDLTAQTGAAVTSPAAATTSHSARSTRCSASRGTGRSIGSSTTRARTSCTLCHTSRRSDAERGLQVVGCR